MEEEEYIPKKSLYQICLANKNTGQIIMDKKSVGYSEMEALKNLNVSQAIKTLNLKKDKVDLYIRVVGVLYESMFDKAFE